MKEVRIGHRRQTEDRTERRVPKYRSEGRILQNTTRGARCRQQ
jgi:hypothetical protein